MKISFDFLWRKSPRTEIKKTESHKKKVLSGAERTRQFRRRSQNDVTYIEKN